MKEPHELFEEELHQVEKIKNDIQDVIIGKENHAKNMAAVRGWRINLRANIRRVNNTASIITEEDLKIAKKVINSLNNALEKFECTQEKAEFEFSTENEALSNLFSETGSSLDKISNQELKENLLEQNKKLFDEYIEVNYKAQDYVKEQRKVMLKNALDAISKDLKFLGPNVVFFDEGTQKLQAKDTLDTSLAEYAKQVVKALGTLSNYYNFGNLLGDLNSIWANRVEAKINEDLDKDLSPEELQNDIFNVLQNLISSDLNWINEDFGSSPIVPQTFEISDRMHMPNIQQRPSISQEVIDNLLSLAKGEYNNTLQNSKYINEAAATYGTMPLKVISENYNIDQVLADLKDLQGIISSFGNERNSSYGARLICNFIDATENLISKLDHQKRSFNIAYEKFENAAEALKNWKKTNWWQNGGQPANHHKSSKNDHAQVTLRRKPRQTKVGKDVNSF